ncbi:unnamed protein product [Caenorhabditis sp. 36 PRJEB53466]|nr:unnamed protein product [Caenorhabditis sp. 36 PRJEB53466]
MWNGINAVPHIVCEADAPGPQLHSAPALTSPSWEQMWLLWYCSENARKSVIQIATILPKMGLAVRDPNVFNPLISVNMLTDQLIQLTTPHNLNFGQFVQAGGNVLEQAPSDLPADPVNQHSQQQRGGNSGLNIAPSRNRMRSPNANILNPPVAVNMPTDRLLEPTTPQQVLIKAGGAGVNPRQFVQAGANMFEGARPTVTALNLPENSENQQQQQYQGSNSRLIVDPSTEIMRSPNSNIHNPPIAVNMSTDRLLEPTIPQQRLQQRGTSTLNVELSAEMVMDAAIVKNEPATSPSPDNQVLVGGRAPPVVGTRTPNTRVRASAFTEVIPRQRQQRNVTMPYGMNLRKRRVIYEPSLTGDDKQDQQTIKKKCNENTPSVPEIMLLFKRDIEVNYPDKMDTVLDFMLDKWIMSMQIHARQLKKRFRKRTVFPIQPGTFVVDLNEHLHGEDPNLSNLVRKHLIDLFYVVKNFGESIVQEIGEIVLKWQYERLRSTGNTIRIPPTVTTQAPQ